VRRHDSARSQLGIAALGFGVAIACGSPKPAATPPAAPTPAPTPEAPSTLPFAPVPPILLRDVGFAAPESVLYDAASDVYLVSNVAGEPLAQDGNGFISRVSPDGSVEKLRWIDGKAGVSLDAPKGMAIVGDKLYVADINVVRSFDRKSGAALGKVAIVAASFLNDVTAAPDGTLYVSDTGLALQRGKTDLVKNGSDAIYSIDARGVPNVLTKGTDLGQPNGLLARLDGVLAVTLSGELYQVTPKGERKALAKLPGSGLDGVAQLEDGRLVVSSWETSSVYVSAGPLAPDVAFDVLIGDLDAPADIGYDPKRHVVMVPLFRQNALYIQQVP
jgi:hypothetical protein